MMVPWFENAKMVYEERERLTAMAQMNKLAPLEALKRTNNRSHEGSLQMAGLLTGQEAERYEKAVEAINALPENLLDLPWTWGRLWKWGSMIFIPRISEI